MAIDRRNDIARARAGRLEQQLSTQSYSRIKTMLGSNAFAASGVIREIDLVREFGMSRTPIREALHRLHAEGLIEPLPHGGYVPVRFSPSDVHDAATVSAMLRALAARLAAANRKRVDLALLRDILDDVDATVAVEDAIGLARALRRFHHAVAAASGNRYLQTMLEQIDETIERFQTVPSPRSARRHRAIFAAINAQDCERAERLTREHIAETLERPVGKPRSRSERRA